MRALALVLLLACGGEESSRRFCPGRVGVFSCSPDGRLWVCSLAPSGECASEVEARRAAGEPTEGLEESCQIWTVGLDVCAP